MKNKILACIFLIHKSLQINEDDRFSRFETDNKTFLKIKEDFEESNNPPANPFFLIKKGKNTIFNFQSKLYLKNVPSILYFTVEIIERIFLMYSTPNFQEPEEIEFDENSPDSLENIVFTLVKIKLFVREVEIFLEKSNIEVHQRGLDKYEEFIVSFIRSFYFFTYYSPENSKFIEEQKMTKIDFNQLVDKIMNHRIEESPWIFILNSNQIKKEYQKNKKEFLSDYMPVEQTLAHLFRTSNPENTFTELSICFRI